MEFCSECSKGRQRGLPTCRHLLRPQLDIQGTRAILREPLLGGSLMVEGLFARTMYLSLYKMHELALHGFPKVALDTLARLIVRRTEPHVKLH